MAGGVGGAGLNRLSSWQKQFVAGLSRATGLEPIVVAAWVLAEGGPPDNPLNIGPGGHFGDPLAATIAFLEPPSRHGRDRAGYYSGILASARTHDPVAEAYAIARSPWDGGTQPKWGDPRGHYGGRGQHLLADLRSLDPAVTAGADGVTAALNTALSKTASAGSTVAGFVQHPIGSIQHQGEELAVSLFKVALRVVFAVLGMMLIWAGVQRLLDPSGEKKQALLGALRTAA